MDTQEALRLTGFFESTHAPLSYSHRLVGEFCTVIRLPGAKLDAPRMNRLVADDNATLSR